MIDPRPYQTEAIDALDLHLAHKPTNPCVVIPTGGGKSITMAWAIQKWKIEYPPFRCMVLAHRKELVSQNAQELHDLMGKWNVGVYAASLKQRDTESDIIFAAIDSVWDRWGEFPAFDVLIVDEAQHIPAKGEGKYRRFIAGCKMLNPNLRVVGFTATPFRLGCGPICHKTHILNEICYEAYVCDLIRDGYLCKLRSKVGDVQPDLENVHRNHGGDYKTNELASAMQDRDLVVRTVASAMSHIQRENRKSVIWFCVDIEHCHRVSEALASHGINAPIVTAKTPVAERDMISDGVKAGTIQHVCNVNVYAEGFNARCIDCVVLLRPTLSPGLYYQQVGRGLRLHPSKSECIVLDYAHCIDEHGPIDCLNAGEVKLIECGNCGDTFSRAIGECPNCGWVIPKKEVERHEAEERERKMHEDEASRRAILGSEPETVDVDAVSVHLHKKAGKPDSLRVMYRSGLSTFAEWICLGHGGYAEKKARDWWFRRFGMAAAKVATVKSALEDMFIEQNLKNITRSITVVRRGKHTEIVGYNLTKTEREVGYFCAKSEKNEVRQLP